MEKAQRASRPGQRRLDLWLSEGHPLWGLPPRERSARARALLDLALGLEGRLAGIEARLAAVEEKLDRALAILTAPKAQAGAPRPDAGPAGEGAPGGEGGDRAPRGGAKVDVASFLAAFDG